MSEETFRMLIIIMAVLITSAVLILTVIAGALVVREAVIAWKGNDDQRKEQG